MLRINIYAPREVQGRSSIGEFSPDSRRRLTLDGKWARARVCRTWNARFHLITRGRHWRQYNIIYYNILLNILYNPHAYYIIVFGREFSGVQTRLYSNASRIIIMCLLYGIFFTRQHFPDVALETFLALQRIET